MPGANDTTSNGRFIDTIDSEDPEYQKQLIRPAEIKEDVKLMHQRKRVSLILNSAEFRKELEEVIKAQQSSGFEPQDSLKALKQIQDFLMPMTLGSPRQPIPINDLSRKKFAKGERLLRCKLASLFRMYGQGGWSNSIDNHVTVRIDRDSEQFLINASGLNYSEVTASNLVKINMKGDILDNGSTHLGIDREGWFFQSALHLARNDIRVVIHLHSLAAVVISGMKEGILPLCNESIVIGLVPIYSSEMAGLDGSETEEEADRKEREAIASLIEPNTRVLISKNNGMFVVAESIELAWYIAHLTAHACEAQVHLSPLGVDQLIIPTNEQRERTINAEESVLMNMSSSNDSPNWGMGEQEFEAMMRKLDAQGYRTGYMYRQPIIYQEKKNRSRMNEDVEIPPASSSFAAHTDELDGTQTPGQKGPGGTHWFNTPNSYHKEEIDEIGTPYPKKITRWIVNTGDENQSSGKAVQIVNPNQFAPQGVNPKEFRDNQRKIKDRYYKDKTTAGPQSKLLEGVSYEDAMKMHEEGVAKAADKEGGEHVVVVGAASRGIIQRDVRHNMVVYQNVYAANPFDKVTDEDLEKYKEDVKKKTDPAYAARLKEEEREREIRISVAKEDVVDSTNSVQAAVEVPSRPMEQPIQRAESARVTEQRSQVIQEIKTTGVSRSKSEIKKGHGSHLKVPHGRDKRSDTSGAEGGRDTDKEDKDGKEKKKKRKFHMPSFSKKHKEKK